MGKVDGDRARAVPAARLRRWSVAGTAAFGWGLLMLAVLHLLGLRNPLTDPISSYAITEVGSSLLAAALLSLAIGTIAVLGMLRAGPAPVSRTTATLFGSSAVGLTMAAAFPTSTAVDSSATSGMIHFYASLVAFLSVPGIGFSMLDRLRGTAAGRQLANMLRWSLVCLALFGLSYAFANWIEVELLTDLLPIGLVQRVVLGMDIALLIFLLQLARRPQTT
ncbi:DUF998 domain-containing protein [Amycolatopsis suaedae]|uniref:DUF998 domain-containing protein n=1 Tax=Amycolatopsis suaedae TaxID=2510978 RepID=A0A4Q7JBH6_9PSEU|nr:DUF998 domain-containing protein [Amycolatopsis suaedae]RZQ64342.1 DUF998 domain-containing protein [Amycolatopsis suaedae]